MGGRGAVASLVPRCRHYCQNFCSKDNYKFIVFRAFTLHLPIFEGIQTLFFFVNFQIWGRTIIPFHCKNCSNNWLGERNLQQDYPVTFLWISIYYNSANMSTKVRCRVRDLPYITSAKGGWGQKDSNFCWLSVLLMLTQGGWVRKWPKIADIV